MTNSHTIAPNCQFRAGSIFAQGLAFYTVFAKNTAGIWIAYFAAGAGRHLSILSRAPLNNSAKPFAMTRLCGTEGIENVKLGSTFRANFGPDYGVAFKTGPLAGSLSRAVVVIDENEKVAYTQQVAETIEEPDYESALAVL